MLVACWSLRGGSGVTTVACSLAGLMARQAPTLLVDLSHGDIPELVRLDTDERAPGVAEWLRAGDGEGLGSCELRVSEDLAVVPVGRGEMPGGNAAIALGHTLAADQRTVVVDCGALGVRPQCDLRTAGHMVALRADVSLLVTRPCRLALRDLRVVPTPITGVVVVREPDRTLTDRDIAWRIGAPVVATVPVDSTVARAIDNGSPGALPALLEQSLRPVVALTGHLREVIA